MLKKVLAAIEDYGMLEKGSTVTVALSGGADSVALLYCLLELKEQFSLNICAAHLNHNLRGDESLRDANFVADLCKKLNVDLSLKSADVSSVAKETGESIELAARRVRYDFLNEVSGGIIATAHTASDSFETMLFNLSRGTAVKGLSGIPPKRDNLIRPLIYCTRADVEEYCKQNNISFVTDSSNLSDNYTRNKIRHNVVPVLREINPAADIAALRTAKTLREDNEFLESTAQSAFEKCVNDKRIDLNVLSNYHPAIAKRVIKQFYEGLFSAMLDNTAIETLYKFCCSGTGQIVLPQCITLRVKNGFLEILTDNKCNVTYEVKLEKQEKINNLLLKNAFDYDKIVGDATVRTRREGDKIRLANRGITKSLKKIFCEEKVPNELRERLPVIADDKGIIWVYGVGISERVKVDDNTKNVIVVKVREKKE
ncbi:MAG: tRNA lysidine(34) synthetase TilS [Clostridia bacterium]|nr:tRNA lysidine(34) synthetase TilS [Clostridia bacterium]